MADADLLGALIAFLKSQATITALVSSRVFGQELPGEETGAMPRKAIVLRYAGQGASIIGRQDYARHGSILIDIWHYGETFYQCDRVRRDVHPILKQLSQQVQSSCLIHNAIKQAGPIMIADPEKGWPIIIDTYSVLYSEVPMS